MIPLLTGAFLPNVDRAAAACLNDPSALLGREPLPASDTLTVPGVPDAPGAVSVLPFYGKPGETALERTKVVVVAEVGGLRGPFVLDTGNSVLSLNRTFLQLNHRTHEFIIQRKGSRQLLGTSTVGTGIAVADECDRARRGPAGKVERPGASGDGRGVHWAALWSGRAVGAWRVGWQNPGRAALYGLSAAEAALADQPASGGSQKALMVAP